MNPKIKSLWLNALRSGDYTQGRDYLRTPHDEYCCLGVLCDLAVEAGVISPPEQTGDEGSWVYGSHIPEVFQSSSDTGLPVAVAAWADTDLNPAVQTADESADVGLAELNDRGKSFTYLADLIEKYLW